MTPHCLQNGPAHFNLRPLSEGIQHFSERSLLKKGGLSTATLPS